MKRHSIMLIHLILGIHFYVFASNTIPFSTKFTPSLNMMSTRGLHQTFSSEALGEGRLTLTLSSGWYSQEKNFNYGPNKGTDVVTSMLAISFGVSSYFDIFTSLSGYGLNNYYGSGNKGGIGTFQGGVQGRLPLSENLPFFLGARISLLGGTASNQINRHAADGYNYFETRTGYDFQALLLQTFRIGKEGKCVKIHLNEGDVVTLQGHEDHLLLLGGGLQLNLHPLISIGVEMNSRTSLFGVQFKTDPLWISPILQFHTPANMAFTLGSDISLSKNRSDDTRALEPYRLFTSINLSYDLLAAKRKAILEKEIREKAAQEQERLQQEETEKMNEELQAKADSIAWKAHSDSLKFVQLREQEKQRVDSILAKANTDSIQLMEAKKSLEEERAKRTDAENQLLSTGLLLLNVVYFETGKSDISINSKPYLMIISKMLLKYPKLKIEVAGHTDNIGSAQRNLYLSQTRAEAVKNFLIQSAPQLTTILTARGYGAARPKSNNSYAEGRKVNRRVELHVLNKEALSEYNR